MPDIRRGGFETHPYDQRNNPNDMGLGNLVKEESP
jgi:hypothetical protein